VQPKLQALQKKHKNDSQRLNQEMMKLYRDNNVNPMGGCFPMLLQMPLLFSLFLVFRSTIEFRGAPFFGWISNLSQPDTIFYLPINIPIYGDQIALLPILLGVSMFLTQKMSMATMDAKQKPIMYIMTAFFFLLFNSFPSGLNLYYLIYNLLNYQQQKSLKKA
jgi:YidC/Oxa1 family membrane protein insertase